MGYDDLMFGVPRLIATVKFNDKNYHVLGCKHRDSLEMYGAFKYKGKANAYRYGSADIGPWIFDKF
jgi:hypothetical protein